MDGGSLRVWLVMGIVGAIGGCDSSESSAVDAAYEDVVDQEDGATAVDASVTDGEAIDADAEVDGGTVPAEFAAMLDAMNAVRAAAEPTPEPALAPFAWSDSLATVARGWAEACSTGYNPDRGGLGENVRRTFGEFTSEDVVLSWAAEAENYDYESNSCAPSQTCGHYTQLVWRATVAVGCGRHLCEDGWTHWVCNFDPPGNLVAQSPY